MAESTPAAIEMERVPGETSPRAKSSDLEELIQEMINRHPEMVRVALLKADVC